MTFFPDLSFYDYLRDNKVPERNIGWLERGHEFERMAPSEETLDLLWSFCTISVMQTRGIHACDLCETRKTVHAVRHGVRFLLGTLEIRVFSKEGDRTSALKQRIREKESSGLILLRSSPFPFAIYAAPTLIYHYVRTHHYKPPDEFLRALSEGPRPPAHEYFERLKKLNLEWKETPPADPNAVPFMFVRTEGEVRRVEFPDRIYIDEG